MANNSYVYTGNPITPKFTLNIGDRILDSETDYDVEIRDNINVGTAHVTISGKGKFKGVIERTFEITPVPARSLSFFADITEFVYTGEPCYMQIAVKFGDVTLKNGVDYDIEYVNNIEPGRANANLYFYGNFFGTMTIPFTITAPEVISEEDYDEAVSDSAEKTEEADAAYDVTVSEPAENEALLYSDRPEETEEIVYASVESDSSKPDTEADAQDGAFINTSDISHRKITLGKKVRVTASAKGGAAPYSFAVFYKKLSSTNWVSVSDFADKTEFVIVPRLATKYQIIVKAKDSSGSISKKAFRITVIEKTDKNLSQKSATVE